jgi:hypothetical protein
MMTALVKNTSPAHLESIFVLSSIASLSPFETDKDMRFLLLPLYWMC